MKASEELLSTMRSTLLLSLMLGITWIMAAFPTSVVQQYLSVILNGLTGVYILVFTALAQKKAGLKSLKKIGNKLNKKTVAETGKDTSSSPSSKNTLSSKDKSEN